MEKPFTIYKAEMIDQDKWQDLIENSAYSSPFQTETFYSICKKSDEVDGFAYAIENQQKKYEALCVVCVQKEKGIKAFFSRRAIIYGGPILSDDCSEDALLLLLKTLEKELDKRVIYIEVRNYANYETFHSAYMQLQWKYIPYLNIKINLDYKTRDELLLSFKENRRRQIRQTLKAGITYKKASSDNEIRQLYNLLKDIYKKEIGLPIPHFSHFINLWRFGLLEAFTVFDKNQVIGGSFCVILKNKAIYTYYYCGLRKHRPKTYPTHLALLAAMEYGIKNQLQYLDFMGAGKPGKAYGVRAYKMRYGGDLVEEGRYLKVKNRFLFWLGIKAISILKKK